MTRGAKGLVLIGLLGGIAVCLRELAVGGEAVWLPFVSESVARFVFRTLTISLGLSGWFV